MTGRAFTLIELLVAVSIILILLSLLFPLIAMVRYQAGKLVCLSNLRQIGIAVMAYQADNRQYIPSPCGAKFFGNYADWGYATWDRQLTPYLTNSASYNPYPMGPSDATPSKVRVGVYRCGLDRAKECDASGNPVSRGIQRRSYQMNFGARDARFNEGRAFRAASVIPSYGPQVVTGDLILLGDRFNQNSSLDNTLGWVGGTYDAPWGWSILPRNHAHPRGESNFLYFDMHANSFRQWSRWDSLTWYTVRGDQ